jgi:hypothetical protein
MARTPEWPLVLKDATLDVLLQGARSPEDLDAVFRDLKRTMTERILRGGGSQWESGKGLALSLTWNAPP